MAPQPLSKVHSTTPVLFHPKALTERPSLAILIARAIAGWSEIEGQMGFLLIKLLGANAEPSLAMYGALTSAPAQIAAVKAAAQLVLDPQRWEVAEAVLRIASSLSTKRHHLAHRIWGYSEDLPDALILADNKDLNVFWLNAFAALRSPSNEGIASLDYPRERVFVYRKRDLEEFISELDELRECFYHLGFMVEPTGDMRAPTLQWLGSRRRIQEELLRIRRPQGLQ